MIGIRRKGRMAALQYLYLNDTCRLAMHEIPLKAISDRTLDEPSLTFARRLAAGVIEHQAEIDGHLASLAANWEVKRMATPDRCILRLGAFELLYELDTPENVIINEAVELAKLYSTNDSGKFVNGLLDQIKLLRPSNKKK